MSATKVIQKVKSVLKNRTRKLFKTEFEKRMIKRDRTFWKDSSDMEKVRVNLSSSTPIEEWQNINNWQRRLENKYNEKQFALKYGCKVAKLYWFGGKEEFRHFDLETLPDNFVIKPNIGHSAKNTFLVKDGVNLFTGRKFTREELKTKINSLFEEQSDLELLFEEFVLSEDGSWRIPMDYKFYMFNGHVAFIMVIKRGPGMKERTYYDEHWNLLKKKVSIKERGYPPVPRPKGYDKMLADARRLSKAYRIFVRLDFYSSPDGPVFGEFTPTPDVGQLHTRYGSKVLIDAWDEHCRGLI